MAWLAALLALSACVEGPGTSAPATVTVAGGAVTVGGPSGYCVDRRLSGTSAGEAFTVLGSCAALSRGGSAPAGVPAVLTATVSSDPLEVPPEPAALEAFLTSAAGRAALSRAGDAATVEVLATKRGEGIVKLFLRDTAVAADGPPTDPAYWRAVFVLRGHLVSATVLSFADRPLGPEDGLRKLDEFVAQLRALNGGAT